MVPGEAVVIVQPRCFLEARAKVFVKPVASDFKPNRRLARKLTVAYWPAFFIFNTLNRPFIAFEIVEGDQ